MVIQPKLAKVKGLNNVSDPLRLGFAWLTQADNIDITDTGAVKKRLGYTRALAGALTAAYATIDHARMYVVDDGALKAMAGSSTAFSLATGLSSAAMYWAEINNQVFYNNGVDRGIIKQDNSILPWAWQEPSAPTLAAVTGSLPAGLYQVCCAFVLADGRMTGAGDIAEITIVDGEALQITDIPQADGCTTSVFIAPANSDVFGLATDDADAALVWNTGPDALGEDITVSNLFPMPLGCSVIQEWGGRIFAAEYMPSAGQTVVWPSQPLGFHLFDLEDDSAFIVPGKVEMLAPHADALIVGTDTDVYAYSEEGLKHLAPYGVVPGQHWSEDDDKTILFWTSRGVCRALPFSNLTEENVSVAPGLRAGGAIVRTGGQKRFLVAVQQGGSAFNQR